jgi:hypothetical protein
LVCLSLIVGAGKVLSSSLSPSLAHWPQLSLSLFLYKEYATHCLVLFIKRTCSGGCVLLHISISDSPSPYSSSVAFILGFGLVDLFYFKKLHLTLFGKVRCFVTLASFSWLLLLLINAHTHTYICIERKRHTHKTRLIATAHNTHTHTHTHTHTRARARAKMRTRAFATQTYI